MWSAHRSTLPANFKNRFMRQIIADSEEPQIPHQMQHLNYNLNPMPDKEEIGVEFFTGELLMVHKPFVKCLGSASLQTHCFRCFEPGAPIECVECKVARYCSLPCKVYDSRDIHSIECGMWMQLPELRCFCTQSGLTGDIRLLFLRLYAMLKKRPKAVEETWTSRYCKPKTFKDVLERPEVRLVTNDMLELCKTFVNLMNLYRPSPKVTVEELIPIAAVIRTKRIVINDQLGADKLGLGIYVIPALMEHHCTPTVALLSRGPELHVRAVTDILKKISPRISYFMDHYSFQDRSLMLKYLYNVKCHCRRCITLSDRHVNIPKLKRVLDQLDKALESLPTDQIGWDWVTTRHYYIVNMYGCMYQDHDVRVTEHYMKVFEMAMKMNMDKHEIFPLYVVTADHVIKTYGMEHPMNLEFEKLTEHFRNPEVPEEGSDPQVAVLG